ncbi:MAG: fatty acid desaturase family protein [Bacteroidota bacterium]
MKEVKFSKTSGSSFTAELREKVNNYFKENNIKKHGGKSIVIKSIIMLTLFLVPIILLLIGGISQPSIIFLLYFISGIGMAGIGMGIMHDALHGSYSGKKSINQLMGYSINLIGANATIWKIQHNVLHHTYTNIDELDDDINTPGILRFSPDRNRQWFHKFQHIYAWFLYGLLTLIWVTTRDFTRIRQYKKMGFFKENQVYKLEILKAVIWKATYFTYALILPIILNPVAWWVIPVAFLMMHFMTGTILSVVFQTAHVMPSNEFPRPDKNGLMKNDWLFHQMETTSNYAPTSRLFSWFIGGLNFQVEHHLLPHISHIHYKGLSKIVKNLAIKYDLPYNSKRNFLSAILAHKKMLKHLGTVPTTNL